MVQDDNVEIDTNLSASVACAKFAGQADVVCRRLCTTLGSDLYRVNINNLICSYAQLEFPALPNGMEMTHELSYNLGCLALAQGEYRRAEELLLTAKGSRHGRSFPRTIFYGFSRQRRRTLKY